MVVAQRDRVHVADAPAVLQYVVHRCWRVTESCVAADNAIQALHAFHVALIWRQNNSPMACRSRRVRAAVFA